MESLCCNVISCRRHLDDKVCVTICSHIFCESCAIEFLSISLVCPACNTVLNEKDEIVLSNLRLSENQKLTLLAGHSPDVIMEIARYHFKTESSRSIAFWNYQSIQESMIRDLRIKELEEGNLRMEHKVQQIIQDANLEIQGIQDRVSFDSKEFELEKKKNSEILDQLNEKTRQLKKLQIMYDKLKRKASVEIHQQMISAENSQIVSDGFDGFTDRYDQRKTGFSAVSQPNLASSSGFGLKRFLKKR